MFNKDTVVCISIAARPGSLGTVLHNAGYRALGLNYIYKAFGTADVAGAIAGVRALGIRGCSISMPFKESVIPHVDALDPAARTIGAVNTVVNDHGRLTGYNTDSAGAASALEMLGVKPDERILVLGAGGVARAILYALREHGCRLVCVAARDAARAAKLKDIHDFDGVAWEKRNAQEADVLINATPIGMTPQSDDNPVDRALVERCRAVADMVATPLETELIAMARAAGKAVAPGYVMSLRQAAVQFRHYTGVEPPAEVLEAALRAVVASRADRKG